MLADDVREEERFVEASADNARNKKTYVRTVRHSIFEYFVCVLSSWTVFRSQESARVLPKYTEALCASIICTNYAFSAVGKCTTTGCCMQFN